MNFETGRIDAPHHVTITQRDLMLLQRGWSVVSRCGRVTLMLDSDEPFDSELPAPDLGPLILGEVVSAWSTE